MRRESRVHVLLLLLSVKEERQQADVLSVDSGRDSGSSALPVTRINVVCCRLGQESIQHDRVQNLRGLLTRSSHIIG